MAAATTSTGAALNLSPELVSEIFSKVKGHSSLAALSEQRPIPFRGNDVMVFSMDGEAELVGEGGEKSPHAAEWKSVTIAPVKVVYQHRLTDEFIHLSEEAQLPYYQAFGDGFAAKIGRALDIMGFHGLNPKTGESADSIASKAFNAKIPAGNVITFDATAADDNLQDAVAKIQAKDGMVTGIAMAPVFGAALADLKVNGVRQFPEFLFGANPGSFYGMGVDINNTVAFGSAKDVAIAGDFQNAFRWGYAENIPLEIIQYGDPDGLGDLKRKNQVVLRAEAYLGWGILDEESFAAIRTA